MCVYVHGAGTWFPPIQATVLSELQSYRRETLLLCSESLARRRVERAGPFKLSRRGRRRRDPPADF